jgi:hypothetical protein
MPEVRDWMWAEDKTAGGTATRTGDTAADNT